MENRLREKIREIERRRDKVKNNMPEMFDKFQEMDLEKDGIYKNIEIAIQTSYDICAMIVKEENLEVPESEQSLPEMLKQQSILTNETAEKLKDMKGFRNALTHKYGKINDKIAYENINEGMQDFEKFISEIEKYVNNQN